MLAAIVTFRETHARLLRTCATQCDAIIAHAHASLAQFVALAFSPACVELGVVVQDFSKWYLVDENISRSLELINEYITLPKFTTKERNFVSTLVNDLLIFSCLSFEKVVVEKPNTVHPGQYTFEKEMCRLSIHVLSCEVLIACLCELCFSLSRPPSSDGHLKGALLLNHINRDEYTLDMPIAQRMLLVSLANVSYNMREKIISDPLFQQIKTSPNLIVWMLACSGSDEQYFLNTCDTASSCTSLTARHSTICNLLILSSCVLREIRLQNDSLSTTEPAFPSYWSSYVPSVRLYVNSCATEVENLLKQIHTQANQFLEEEKYKKTILSHSSLPSLSSSLSSPPSSSSSSSSSLSLSPLNVYLSRLFKLTKEWNYSMQVLSSIFSPHQPIVLTRKPFSERWHLSAFVMWILCSLTKYIPGQPASDARTRSSHEITYIRPHLYHTFRTQVTSYEDNNIFYHFSSSVRESPPSLQLKMVRFLWRKALKRGGLLYSSREYVKGVGVVGHLNVMFATLVNTDNTINDGAEEEYLTRVRKKVFLISDPEICNFKVLTLMQMFELLCNVQYNLNLLDVVAKIRG